MDNLKKPKRETTYDKWIKEQGLPIIPGFGIEKVLELPREPWPRLGGKGAFIKLAGMEGVTGLYVVEILNGGALNPEKHLYEEIMYVLQGRGSTEVVLPGSDQKSMFEWQVGALFGLPLNAPHRLYNGSGTEPAVLIGFTNAPVIMDIFHNPDFVLNDPYVFQDRFDGRSDYYVTPGERYIEKLDQYPLLVTNVVPDMRTLGLEAHDRKGAGVTNVQLELADGILVAHCADWPLGRYHKAHYHGAGAVLVILRSVGYTLLWPVKVGTRPFESGHDDQVVRVDWREGSIFSPPDGWFHQHFNTGPVPARQLALRYGTRRYGVEFRDHLREGVLTDIKKGGSLIEYEDEDPEIRRLFEAECTKNGVQSQMPTVAASAG